MTLPEVREAMFELAKKLSDAGLTGFASGLTQLAEETRRRSPIQRAAATARPITPAIRKEVRRTARAHPDWSLRKIGQHCGVDQGRVSEILRGYRR